MLRRDLAGFGNTLGEGVGLPIPGQVSGPNPEINAR
jgi:hypothetical protein